MKVNIIFNLPEDKSELLHAQRGRDYHNSITEMMLYIRQQLKYAELTKEEDDIYSKLQEKFFEILNENNIFNI